MEINERFTVSYIERESFIIINYFSPRSKKRKFCVWTVAPTAMDLRIMKNLGIRR
jgi:hypothetical protein